MKIQINTKAIEEMEEKAKEANELLQKLNIVIKELRDMDIEITLS